MGQTHIFRKWNMVNIIPLDTGEKYMKKMCMGRICCEFNEPYFELSWAPSIRLDYFLSTFPPKIEEEYPRQVFGIEQKIYNLQFFTSFCCFQYIKFRSKTNYIDQITLILIKKINFQQPNIQKLSQLIIALNKPNGKYFRLKCC